MKTDNPRFSHFKKIKKIPVILGIVTFILVLIVGVYLIGYSRSFITKGSSENPPQETKITNISDNSFTVSWYTADKSSGLVYFGEESGVLINPVNDIRNTVNGENELFYTHYFLIENLKPQKKYYFQILSDSKTYNNSGKPYEVTTAVEKPLPQSDITQGKILTSQNEAANGAIVYLSMANTTMQSSLTDNEGNWMIPLSTARTNDLQDFTNYDNSSQIIELFIRGNSKYSNVTLSTSQDNPTPDIILGENYNFLSVVPTQIPSSILTQQSNLSAGSSNSASLESTVLSITYPAENEKVTNQFPQFFGRGPKLQKIDILIEPKDKTSETVTIDNQGRWQYSPTRALTNGEYKVTVSYTNAQNFTEKVSHSFLISLSEVNIVPAFTATGSGQFTGTPTPKLLATNTPTTKPISTPTLFKTASPTPTSSLLAGSPSPTAKTPTPTKVVLTQTPFPTIDQTRTTMPSTSSGTYKSGSTVPTAIFGIIGGVITVIGVFLLVI